jgi:hypothetical protein
MASKQHAFSSGGSKYSACQYTQHPATQALTALTFLTDKQCNKVTVTTLEKAAAGQNVLQQCGTSASITVQYIYSVGVYVLYLFSSEAHFTTLIDQVTHNVISTLIAITGAPQALDTKCLHTNKRSMYCTRHTNIF